MFDPPSNLPLEPLPSDKPEALNPERGTSEPATPDVQGSTLNASVPTPAPLSPFGKKEPEDIFADIDKPDQVGRPMPAMTPPAPRHGSPIKAIVIAIVALLIVGGAGYAAWVFFINQPSVSPTPVVTPSPQPIVEIPPVTEPTPTPVVTPPVTEPTPTATAPVTVPPEGTNIPPPTSVATPPQAVEAVDADTDGLSDAEEQLFGTNPTIADTDGDGFPDGAEVASDYDPAVPRGVLSMSVWLRKTTIGTEWSFLLPISWTLGSDRVPGDYAVQTGTPATFTFHFDTLDSRQTFVDWLQQNDPVVDVTSLRSFQTKQGNSAWQSPDRLTTYIVSGAHVVRVRYQLNGAVSYDYRAMYDMMLERAMVL